MDDAPRIPTALTTRQLADPARWPVLARLSDVSADSPAPRSAKQASNYRFDPPQCATSSGQSTSENPESEIQTGTKTFRRHQPHVFERGRAGDRSSRNPRRESSILPRSNPFSIPRPRLVDSLSPVVRFLTMVALFTAAGTWIQMMGRHASPVAESMEPPKTTAQQAVGPAKNTADRPVPAPTAAGPLETNPQSGARVGRADGDDFASHNKSTTATHLADHPAVTPPHFLVAGSGRLPQVQTSDSQSSGGEACGELSRAAGTRQPDQPGAGSPARADVSDRNSESGETPAVASYPGFLIEIPTR